MQNEHNEHILLPVHETRLSKQQNDANIILATCAGKQNKVPVLFLLAQKDRKQTTSRMHRVQVL